jgi:hypothetical protein
LKFLRYFFVACCFAGCSRDPAAPGVTPSLDTATLTDSLSAVSIGMTRRECQIDLRLVYSINNYSLIKAGSDSDMVTVYLHSGKTISTAIPYNVSGVVRQDYRNGDLLARSVQGGWTSDTTAHVLRASDTLTTIDSSTVDIWWWYNGSRQTHHRIFP